VRGWLIGLALWVVSTAGADEAVYLMRGAALPAPHSVNGYSMDVRDRADGGVEVHVETALIPIGAKGTYSEVLGGGPPVIPKGFSLPARIRGELRPGMSSWEAATTVLWWVTAHLRLVDDDQRPQDAASVLERGGGRCSGLANATTALLLAAGFEARTVSGLLMTDREAIPHRWVECRLPGAGWVPTDPTLGLWTVTPRHVVFDDTVNDTPAIEVVKAETGELDRLPRRGTTMVRPNQGAELVCRLDDLEDDREVVAWLQRGSDRRHAVLGREVRFSSLLPGRWLLVVELDGRVVERREFDLRTGVVHSYVIRLPASGKREEVES
jgi:hypothetical protein